MFWTCDEQCTYNRDEYERRRKYYHYLHKDYMSGLAEVRNFGVETRPKGEWRLLVVAVGLSLSSPVSFFVDRAFACFMFTPQQSTVADALKISQARGRCIE